MPLPTNPPIAYTDAETFSTSYSNSIQVKMTMWDFQLVFGLLKESVDGTVNIENRQAVYISASQAKALAEVLTTHVRLYEENFGVIPLKLWPTSTVKM